MFIDNKEKIKYFLKFSNMYVQVGMCVSVRTLKRESVCMLHRQREREAEQKR